MRRLDPIRIMKNTPIEIKRLVKRAKRLLADLDEADLVLSLVTGGAQASAVIHPWNESAEGDSCYPDKENFHELGKTGVGEMISL